MKVHLVSLLALAVAAGFLAGPASAEPKEKWSVTGFSHPESVDLDIAHQVFYVSNINGGPLDKDGNGFISRVSRDGKMLDLKWIEGGMNAPKGIVMQGYKMWVTDIDRLHEIDTRTGKIVASYDAPGAKFLNDPAVDANGNVYVSDIALKTIWQLKDGKMAIWYDKPDLMHINGLRVIYGGKLLLAGFGAGNLHDDGTTDSLGYLMTIDLKTKELKTLGNGTPVGNLDGIERDAHGNFLATDFTSGGLFRIYKDGHFDKLLPLTKGSADMDAVDHGHTAVIPLMLQDTVSAYSVD
jgi:outer membrane protein assembly factor BamB